MFITTHIPLQISLCWPPVPPCLLHWRQILQSRTTLLIYKYSPWYRTFCLPNTLLRFLISLRKYLR